MDYNPNIMRDIFNKATALYDGDRDAANNWMVTDNDDFGGYSPLSYCKPYDGAVKVESYLDQKLRQKNTPPST